MPKKAQVAVVVVVSVVFGVAVAFFAGPAAEWLSVAIELLWAIFLAA